MKFQFPRKVLITIAAVAALAAPRARAGTDVSGAAARPSPEWLRNGTIYEIFPRDFSRTGDLNGVTAQLDRLNELGVNILWLMPIHPIGEKLRKGTFGSPYAIKDYYAIDPDYGTLDDFKKLVAGAHQRNLKVIMDLVADHTAWDSVMMKHPEFYKHDAQGNVISPEPEWTDVAALNYGNPELRQYMLAMLKYWVQTCDVDGFRCDAAAMVPTDFWEKSRAELTRIKPDIVLLAEASKPELMVKAFDLDYSWPLLTTLNHVLVRGAPARELRASWEESRRQFPQGSLHLRISDDHDEARAVTRFGQNGALAASALMFTLDGVPLIYNGMEVGDTSATSGNALFEQRRISWLPKNNPPLRDIYHGLIQLRKQHAALRSSRVDWLHNSDEARLLTFLRADDKDQLLVVINFSDHPLSGKVDLKDVAGFVPINLLNEQSSKGGSLPELNLNSFEWRIYHRSSMVPGGSMGSMQGGVGAR
jgi:glycosidase